MSRNFSTSSFIDAASVYYVSIERDGIEKNQNNIESIFENLSSWRGSNLGQSFYCLTFEILLLRDKFSRWYTLFLRYIYSTKNKETLEKVLSMVFFTNLKQKI